MHHRSPFPRRFLVLRHEASLKPETMHSMRAHEASFLVLRHEASLKQESDRAADGSFEAFPRASARGLIEALETARRRAA